jgi:hypothetical protein
MTVREGSFALSHHALEKNSMLWQHELTAGIMAPALAVLRDLVNRYCEKPLGQFTT